MHPIQRIRRPSAALALAALAAQAAMATESGPYAGLALGVGHGAIERRDFGPFNAAAGFAEDRSDRLLSVFGGYRFDRTWSVEGGYADGGRYRETVTARSGSLYLDTAYPFDLRARSWFLAALASVDLAGRWSGHVRLGITVNRATMNASVDASRHVEPPVLPCPPGEPACYPPFSTSPLFAGAGRRSVTRVAPRLGLGLAHPLTAAGTLRVDLDDFGRFGDASTTGRLRLRTLGLAYVQSF